MATTETETYRTTVEFGATPTSMVVVPASKKTEFENFKGLAAKLLHVPKHELDEQRDS